MKKIIGIIFLVALPFLVLSGCTTYEGAAYIKKDLHSLACSNKSAQTADIKTAKADCIKSTVDEEYFKSGVSETTLDWIKEVNRITYRGCMDDKGFACSWGPENK